MNYKIINIESSPRKGKRFRVFLNDNNHYDFGLKNSSTYLEHTDEKKRDNYIKRHLNNSTEKYLIQTLTPSPALFSLFLLWGKYTSLKKNINHLNNLWKKPKHIAGGGLFDCFDCFRRNSNAIQPVGQEEYDAVAPGAPRFGNGAVAPEPMPEQPPPYSVYNDNRPQNITRTDPIPNENGDPRVYADRVQQINIRAERRAYEEELAEEIVETERYISTLNDELESLNGNLSLLNDDLAYLENKLRKTSKISNIERRNERIIQLRLAIERKNQEIEGIGMAMEEVNTRLHDELDVLAGLERDDLTVRIRR